MADVPVTGLNTTQTVKSPTGLTEEEATRYDRQMRLWGIEAQQRYYSRHSNLSTAWTSLSFRMRNATILVIRLRGVATEVIKNVVLAGIGKLIVMDGENVSEEDLGAGFFFRDGDVGLKVRRVLVQIYMVIYRILTSAESRCCQIKNREPQPPCDRGDHYGYLVFGRRRV
jgi:hypothetical protein